MILRRRLTAKQATEHIVSLDVNKLDDFTRIESKIKDTRLFESWREVIDFVYNFKITPHDVSEVIMVSDPGSGKDAVSGFIWGIALALKAADNDPCNIVRTIARGLEDFILPGSFASTVSIAEKFGCFASMMLNKYNRTVAIIGERISICTIETLSSLIREADHLSGEKRHILIICEGSESWEYLRKLDGCFLASAEFSREYGRLRVYSSTTFHRPDESSSVVYAVSNVEEGVAILDFEEANLCVVLAGPGSAMFAHPVVGVYVKKSRRSDRLVRAVALEINEHDDVNEVLSQLSAYMIDMYTDLHIHCIEFCSKDMEKLGFLEISGAGAVKAIMTLAHIVAAALPRFGYY